MELRTNRTVQYLAGICASLTFMFTGATLAWPSPAIPKIRNGEAHVELTNDQISWMVALLSLGALPGCYLGQRLSDGIGRRGTIYCASLPGLAGACIIFFTDLAGLIYLARLLMGISTGTIAVVAMVYVTEIADKEIRGQMGMLIQVMSNLGGLVVYSVGPYASYNLLNSVLMSIPLLIVILCSWIPESPYYYLKNGNFEKARIEYMILKGIKDQKWADQQLLFIEAHVKDNMANKTTLRELFTNLNYRKAIYIIAGLKILQYMTGIVAIQAYLEPIFRQSSSIPGPLASIIYGFVQLGAGVTATFITGCFGRRVLMLVSSLGVAFSMTILGIYFFLQDYVKVSPAALASVSSLPILGVLCFNVLYAVGIGNLPYVMQTELFPINVKLIASSVATMFSCVLVFTVTKLYQVIKDTLGHYTVFWFFAAVAYIGVWFIYRYVPETRGKTLEEILNNMEKHNEVEEESLNEDQTLGERRYSGIKIHKISKI